MRIAKAMAHAGLCSRRDAEKWIEQGRVAVNGTALTTPAYVVKPGDDVIRRRQIAASGRGAAAVALP